MREEQWVMFWSGELYVRSTCGGVAAEGRHFMGHKRFVFDNNYNDTVYRKRAGTYFFGHNRSGFEG